MTENMDGITGLQDVSHEASARRGQEVVYVVRQGDTHYYKIGTSENFSDRLSNLQTASPHDLIIVKLFNGGWHLEQRLHKLFQKYRVRGEWFHIPNPKLVTELGFPRYSKETETVALRFLIHKLTGIFTDLYEIAENGVTRYQVLPEELDPAIPFIDFFMDRTGIIPALGDSPAEAAALFVDVYGEWERRGEVGRPVIL